MSTSAPSRNTSLASVLFSVISILVGLFILLAYSLVAVEAFEPLVTHVFENYALTEVPNAKENINGMFSMAFGNVPWVAGAGLIVIGFVNEWRRRRTVTRQRIRR